jgi:hypothetical protein
VTSVRESGAGTDGGRSDGPSLRFVVVSESATPLVAVSALLQSHADIILVSRRPDSRRAEDIVGVLTPVALAHLIETDAELS